MDKEQILNSKSINAYLITPTKSLKIEEDIIPDMVSFELFEAIDEKTKKLVKHFSNEVNNTNCPVKANLYLIYCGNEVIDNFTNFSEFINKNKDKIVGIFRHPTTFNNDMYQGYILPYYEIGSFYFDFEMFINEIERKNIDFEVSKDSTKQPYELITYLSKKLAL